MTIEKLLRVVGLTVALATGSVFVGSCGTRGAAVSSSEMPKLPVTAATTCKLDTDLTKRINVAGDREVLCAVDIGSKHAKLIVVSWEKGKPGTMSDERQCRNRLDLGAKTFDFLTGTGKDLPQADLADLVMVVRQFQDICRLDKALMVGAIATQWARDATNKQQIVDALKAQTGLTLEILTAEQEATFGYSAATYNRPGNIVVDPGSNSIQIAFHLTGDEDVESVSVPLGYVRAGAKYFSNSGDTTIRGIEVARRRYVEYVKAQIDMALGTLVPPTSLGQLRQAVGVEERLGIEIFIVGQDHTLLYGVDGTLKPGGRWIDDKTTYERTVRRGKPISDPKYTGQIMGIMESSTLANFFKTIRPSDFRTLRSAPVRELYGDKLMANATLIDMLATELGLMKIVFVPQELPTGYILSKVVGNQ